MMYTSLSDTVILILFISAPPLRQEWQITALIEVEIKWRMFVANAMRIVCFI